MAFILICITQCTGISSETQQQTVLIAIEQIDITFTSNFKDNKEFRVSLFKGVKKSITVCSGSFNSSYQSFESNSNQSIKGLGIPTESKITLYLSGLTENDTDIYYFHKENMYPPPYTCYQDNGTVIHVKELVPTGKPTLPQPILPLLVGIGVTVAYSVAITAAFCYVLKKGRRTRVLQSEYINVVPRRPKCHQPYAPTPAHCRPR
ncbi:CD28 molecule L homeolog [Xenopus laevis]|uniref:CD28 molecule L homeolog n=1 Tax=Xenopus laevis TaxID=8355 RepID=A1L2W1_XENLA|nr:CD28 molecule L homeolog [Xenopus laevis]AAI29735.1 LOC100036969 protein [Xenopus laevis]